MCDVCCGSGTYPIIDRFGTTRYEIKCPECLGISDEELKAACDRDAALLARFQSKKNPAAGL